MLAWTRLLLLDGQLARAEPKALRCILHLAGRLIPTRTAAAAAHRQPLALAEHHRHRLHAAAVAAATRQLTEPTSPFDQGHGDSDPVAGGPVTPTRDTTIVSPRNHKNDLQDAAAERPELAKLG